MNYSARVTEKIPSYTAKLKSQNTTYKTDTKETINPYNVNVKVEEVEYATDMSDIQTITKIDGEVYEGDYDVKPNFVIQTLDTNQKYMSDDVTVQAIEVSSVSNLSGGNTIYIGGII